MQYHITIDVEVEDKQPRLTVQEIGEQCPLCVGVEQDDALMRIGTLLDRWGDEVLRLEG